MSDFTKITVVSVTGLQSLADGALLAIEQSMRSLPGSRGLLMSPARPTHLPNDIMHIAVKPFGYLEYSLFMLYALGEFIRTEFVLVVQNDGWVLNGSNWREEFFNYDYLGAPVHLARVTHAGQSSYRYGFEWLPYLNNPECRVENIYNGGFSLRSKRLLEAPRKLGLEFKIPVPGVCPGPPFALHWQGEMVLEDVWLCLTVRSDLEDCGLRLPNLGVAREFSIEHAIPAFHTPDIISNIFGHHSRLRTIRDLTLKQIDYGLRPEQVGLVYGEQWIVDEFNKNNYQISWANP